MKGVLRWLLHIAGLSSALICLLIVAVWARSYWIGDMWLWYEEPLTSNIIRVGHGYIQYASYDVSRMSGVNLLPGYYRQDSSDDRYFTNLQIGQTHFAFAGLLFDRTKSASYTYQPYFSYNLAYTRLI